MSKQQEPGDDFTGMDMESLVAAIENGDMWDLPERQKRGIATRALALIATASERAVGRRPTRTDLMLMAVRVLWQENAHAAQLMTPETVCAFAQELKERVNRGEDVTELTTYTYDNGRTATLSTTRRDGEMTFVTSRPPSEMPQGRGRGRPVTLCENGTTDPHAVSVHIDRRLLLELMTLVRAMRWAHSPDVRHGLDIPVADRDQPSAEWCLEFAIRSFFGAIGYESPNDPTRSQPRRKSRSGPRRKRPSPPISPGRR